MPLPVASCIDVLVFPDRLAAFLVAAREGIPLDGRASLVLVP